MCPIQLTVSYRSIEKIKTKIALICKKMKRKFSAPDDPCENLRQYICIMTILYGGYGNFIMNCATAAEVALSFCLRIQSDRINSMADFIQKRNQQSFHLVI